MTFQFHLPRMFGQPLGCGLLWFALIAATCGCHSESPWQLRNVGGHLPDLRFALIDDMGQPVTAGDYRGYTVLLYFGFTNCAAECSTTMARLASVLHRLGDEAHRIRILFVTVDPDRDTPEVLQRYMKSFDAEHANGLTGDKSEIADLARRCRAAYRDANGTPATPALGDIPHGNAIYIFDRQGLARLLASDQDSDQALISDLRRLAHPAGWPGAAEY